MGSRITALARNDARCDIVAAIDRDDAANAAAIAPDGLDVIIDFSSDEGAQQAARLALHHRAALLVGTTGLSENSLEIIGDAARSIPVMIAPNTSLGVAVLTHLIVDAATRLGPDYAIDMVETHHTMKKDAPSGTALRLARALQQAGIHLPMERIQAIREGDVIGRHTIHFNGPNETITITHDATNRDLFARGALRAALWLCGQSPGHYSIDQSLAIPHT